MTTSFTRETSLPAGGYLRSAFVPPRTKSERRIAEIWERILGCRPIGVDQDFYSLGGHSLLAVRLIEELRAHCGWQPEFATLLACPTVADLAARLDEFESVPSEQGPGRAAIVAPPTDGTRPFLFCLPGLGATPLQFCRFAQLLGKDWPVHALRYRPHENDARQALTIEGMARELVAEVRRAQPLGPYYLCGFSVGGVVAFELAHVLRGLGEPVTLLVLLDAFNPRLPATSAAERLRALFLEHPPDAALRAAWSRLRKRVTRGMDIRPSIRAERALLAAVRRYTPAPYPGPALLVRARPGSARDSASPRSHSNGWGELTPRLRVTTVDALHDELLTTRAATTAQALEDALLEAAAATVGAR